MPKKEAPLTALARYLPEGSVEPVLALLQQHKVHLTVSRERRTLLGDYRHRTAAEAHRISVNGSLNKYAFLITLLHELAHLTTFERWGNRVDAHGKEWKSEFAAVLKPYVQAQIFPDDIAAALRKSLTNAAASSCADAALQRVLHHYDVRKEGTVLVENIATGSLFQTDDGRIFQKGAQLRKRFQCMEVKTKRLYLFSPVYAVRVLNASM